MKKKVFAVLCAAIVSLFFAKVDMSEARDLKPGMWEFKTTSVMPMMPAPKVTTKTDCITAEEASNNPLDAMLEDGNCRVLSMKESGNTIEFEMECDNMDMKMRGKGYFTSGGTTASGKMEMTMDMPQMGGKSMTMSQEWEGKRTGNCD
ncbi:MAG: DUF3617 family protein [Planctomycetes bacterium]|nr:DUF3617 family protein [Planctomycetota bacterium]